MARFELNPDGLSALMADLEAEALRPAADHVAEVARQLAPRSSAEHAHMADSIKAVRNGPAEFRISFDSEHWYGVFAEVGTEKESPRPFLRPALDSIEGRVVGPEE